MDEYMVERYITTCEHCNNISIHQEKWICFGRNEKHTYKCGWCGKITTSTWAFAHPTIVGAMLRIDKKTCHPSEFPIPNFYQYPIKEESK
jgi:hypothetical protein